MDKSRVTRRMVCLYKFDGVSIRVLNDQKVSSLVHVMLGPMYS